MDQIQCPSCGESFQINDSYRGRSFECHCGQVVNVPAGGAAPPPPPPPPYGYGAAAQPAPPPGTTAFVLGILGLVVCAFCAPFAWASGGSARRGAMAQGLQPDGLATAGWVMGIIGTVLLGIGVIVGIFWIIFAVSMAGMSMH